MSERPETDTSTGPGSMTVVRASERELVITRTFDAPARIVWAAWTQPALFQRWWVPRSMGMTLRSCELDVRTGGGYRLVFENPGGPPLAFFGTYVEVAPPTRLVWTNDEAGEAGQVTTVTLEERDGRTRLVMRELYPSKAALDEAGTGAAEGLREPFAQLAELLATEPGLG